MATYATPILLETDVDALALITNCVNNMTTTSEQRQLKQRQANPAITVDASTPEP
jgi:hypothetical protein